jgi:hypothetical protein
MKKICGCADRHCPAPHNGTATCHVRATITLYRVDMDDRTGTDMCEPCADDAMASGLFY